MDGQLRARSTVQAFRKEIAVAFLTGVTKLIFFRWNARRISRQTSRGPAVCSPAQPCRLQWASTALLPELEKSHEEKNKPSIAARSSSAGVRG